MTQPLYACDFDCSLVVSFLKNIETDVREIIERVRGLYQSTQTYLQNEIKSLEIISTYFTDFQELPDCSAIRSGSKKYKELSDGINHVFKEIEVKKYLDHLMRQLEEVNKQLETLSYNTTIKNEQFIQAKSKWHEHLMQGHVCPEQLDIKILPQVKTTFESEGMGIMLSLIMAKENYSHQIVVKALCLQRLFLERNIFESKKREAYGHKKYFIKQVEKIQGKTSTATLKSQEDMLIELKNIKQKIIYSRYFVLGVESTCDKELVYIDFFPQNTINLTHCKTAETERLSFTGFQIFPGNSEPSIVLLRTENTTLRLISFDEGRPNFPTLFEKYIYNNVTTEIGEDKGFSVETINWLLQAMSKDVEALPMEAFSSSVKDSDHLLQVLQGKHEPELEALEAFQVLKTILLMQQESLLGKIYEKLKALADQEVNQKLHELVAGFPRLKKATLNNIMTFYKSLEFDSSDITVQRKNLQMNFCEILFFSNENKCDLEEDKERKIYFLNQLVKERELVESSKESSTADFTKLPAHPYIYSKSKYRPRAPGNLVKNPKATINFTSVSNKAENETELIKKSPDFLDNKTQMDQIPSREKRCVSLVNPSLKNEKEVFPTSCPKESPKKQSLIGFNAPMFSQTTKAKEDHEDEINVDSESLIPTSKISDIKPKHETNKSDKQTLSSRRADIWFGQIIGSRKIVKSHIDESQCESSKIISGSKTLDYSSHKIISKNVLSEQEDSKCPKDNLFGESKLVQQPTDECLTLKKTHDKKTRVSKIKAILFNKRLDF